MRPKYENVVIFSPAAVTGGPEALHQLAHAINEIGGTATIAYFNGDGSNATFKDGHIDCLLPQSGPVKAYEIYQPRVSDRIEVTDSTFLVFPEVLTGRAEELGVMKRAIWWLSVANAESNNHLLAYDTYRRRLLTKPGLTHFFQSEHAKRYVLQHGEGALAPLFDYIDRNFFSVPAGIERDAVSYFPMKGGSLAEKFFQYNSDLSALKIQGMSRQQVVDALQRSMIYIDFGHHPGKDRVPREAAASGSIVFAHRAGAALNYLDYPIDDFYKFTLEDINSGELRERIDLVKREPEKHRAAQAYFRQKIYLEKEEFYFQIKSIFFRHD
jgi:hypothetical protein